MNPVSAVRRRAVCALLAICLLLSTSVAFLSGKALDPTQTLKVYAQYWGDPDSATLLKEFTREEITEMSYGEYGYDGYYCNVTNVNTVMRIHARGVKLAEFLRYEVGVDLTSVRQLDFHTTDVAADARFLSKGREELLDSARYWYPNLIDHAYVEDGQFKVDDEVAAAEGAVQVPTLIAVVQYSTKNPLDDVSGEMTEKDTFRLCEGQPDLTTKTSFESARWVDEIYVVLAGAPPEEPTEPDTPEEPTEPDEKPTGSDITPAPEEPTNPEPTAAPKPTETPNPTSPPTAAPTDGPNGQSTTNNGGSNRLTTRRTQSTGTTETPNPTSPPTAAPTDGPNGQSTTNNGGSNRLTTRRTQSTGTTTATTARAFSTTTTTVVSETNRQIAEQNTVADSAKMEQLVVNGYDSLIQWKKEPDEEVSPLKKPLVTTKGARNAAIMFVASFGVGAVAMYRWFKEEQ